MRRFILALLLATTILPCWHSVSWAVEGQVVGVLSDFNWLGGCTDPIDLDVRVSTDNRNDLYALLISGLYNTSVEFSFIILQYDPSAGQYFMAAHTNGETLLGLIRSDNGQLQVQVSADQALEVLVPANYGFTISIMPQDLEQEIWHAVSVDGQMFSPWGTCIGEAAARWPPLVYSCDVESGFSWPNNQATVGYLKDLTIGGIEFARDFQVNAPAEVPVELLSFTVE